MKLTLTVIGMHCQGCAVALEETLTDLAFVQTVHVDREHNQVELTVIEPYSLEVIQTKIEELGFQLA